MNAHTATLLIALLAILLTSYSTATDSQDTVVKAGVENLPPQVIDASAEWVQSERDGTDQIVAHFRVVEPNGMNDLAERECVLKNPAGEIVSRAPAKVEGCGETRCSGDCSLALGEPQDGTYSVEVSVADKQGEKALAQTEFQYQGAQNSEKSASPSEQAPRTQASQTPQAAAAAAKPAVQQNLFEVILAAIAKFFAMFR